MARRESVVAIPLVSQAHRGHDALVEEGHPIEIDLGSLPLVVRPTELDFPVVLLHYSEEAEEFAVHYSAFVPSTSSLKVDGWDTGAAAVVGGGYSPEQAIEALAALSGNATPTPLWAEARDGNGRIYTCSDGDTGYASYADGWLVSGSWQFTPRLPVGETRLWLELQPFEETPDMTSS